MDFTPPSKMDYIEHVNTQNNMDIKVYDPVSWLGKTDKSLFIFLFLFLFFGLTTQERVQESITWPRSQVTVTTHDDCGKVVYKLGSNCISSIQKLIGTLLSFSCQLRLGVDLSYLG